MPFDVPPYNLDGTLDADDVAEVPDPPDAPGWMSSEAAYGFSCGWSTGYEAALKRLIDGGADHA